MREGSAVGGERKGIQTELYALRRWTATSLLSGDSVCVGIGDSFLERAVSFGQRASSSTTMEERALFIKCPAEAPAFKVKIISVVPVKCPLWPTALHAKRHSKHAIVSPLFISKNKPLSSNVRPQ